ncbi:patatin-like phospholipase RssA [Myxococcota bacterium]|nr:patatin-like phospholipase RssA [Myxococcota bacterium]
MTSSDDQEPTTAETSLEGRVGLALGSGGAKGWAHIGVIRALEEAGIHPAIVCGTSMGGVVGAAYAAGELEALEQWVLGLEMRRIMTFFDLSLRGGVIKARRLFEFFESVLPDRDFESLDMPCAVVATDLSDGREVWLREGNLLDALRATIALPGLITPAARDGRWLVDGGLVNPVPVSLCRSLGADSVIAVDLNTTLLGRRLTGETSETSARIVPQAIGARFDTLLRDLAADMRERLGREPAEVRDETPSIYEVIANSVNIMQMRIGRSRMAGDPPELLVTPRMSDFGLLDFDRADEAIEVGRRAVAQALQLGAPEAVEPV